MRLAIRWRLTAAFAITLMLVLVGLGLLVQRRAAGEANDAIDVELRNRATAYFDAGEPNAQLRSDLLGLSDERFGQELDQGGKVVTGSAQLVDRPIAAAVAGLRDATVATSTERRAVRLFVTTRNGRTLLLATAVDDRDEMLRTLQWSLIAAGMVTLAVGTTLAWLLAGAALRPVDRLRAAAESYSATDLSGRLEVPTPADELRRLAITLNEMLARIEDSFERQRSFVDHASHELRTPLANLSMELELALRGTHDEKGLRRALFSAADETGRLVRLTSNLLVFARLADDRMTIAREPTAIDELARATVATFAARAAAARITLTVDVPNAVTAAVDPVRVRQALTNLLDNALNATPAGGAIIVSVAAQGEVLTLSVRDGGSGFAPGLAAVAFEPFVRGRVADSRPDGAGLGLAIVAAVAAAHGGTASIRPAATGTIVAIEIPRHRSDR